MGLKLKSSKGEISINDNNGRIRLRWRYAEERYSLNLPFAYSQDNLSFASIKAAEIKLDMLKGSFDPTLKKYKAATTHFPNGSSNSQLLGKPQRTPHEAMKKESFIK